MSFEGYGFPLFLLATLWTAWGPLLTAIKMMDGRRDRILSLEEKISTKHAEILLYRDWITIHVFTYAYLLMIGLFTIVTPFFLEGLNAWMIGVCVLVGSTMTLNAIFCYVQGFSEFRVMNEHVKNMQNYKTYRQAA